MLTYLLAFQANKRKTSDLLIREPVDGFDLRDHPLVQESLCSMTVSVLTNTNIPSPRTRKDSAAAFLTYAWIGIGTRRWRRVAACRLGGRRSTAGSKAGSPGTASRNTPGASKRAARRPLGEALSGHRRRQLSVLPPSRPFCWHSRSSCRQTIEGCRGSAHKAAAAPGSPTVHHQAQLSIC